MLSYEEWLRAYPEKKEKLESEYAVYKILCTYTWNSSPSHYLVDDKTLTEAAIQWVKDNPTRKILSPKDVLSKGVTIQFYRISSCECKTSMTPEDEVCPGCGHGRIRPRFFVMKYHNMPSVTQHCEHNRGSCSWRQLGTKMFSDLIKR